MVTKHMECLLNKKTISLIRSFGVLALSMVILCHINQVLSAHVAQNCMLGLCNMVM